MTGLEAAIRVSSSLVVMSLVVGTVSAILAYSAARRYEARAGVAAWHLPAGLWAFIFFLSWLIGLVLFFIAKATTRTDNRSQPTPAEPVPPVAPSPVAGWYPDPSGRHELRYWDGKGWTDHVRDGATRAVDPT